jgi:rare lipoprotein A (peptidoglycan hydrolase)
MRIRGLLIVAAAWLLTSAADAGASSLIAYSSFETIPFSAVPASATAHSSTDAEGDADSDADSDPAYVEIGKASWYGSQFQGRRTANGERFDRRRMTAAHPTLPLDTVVKVTNLRNGKSVEVRVNDRGPHRKGRVIDLSAKAAEELGMKGRGIAVVKIEVLADEEG